MSIAIHAFYRFIPLTDLETRRADLKRSCLAHAVAGTMILAPEGLNATLAGSPEAMATVLADIARICHVRDLQTRVATAAVMPFRRLKITIKPEIVTLRDARAQPDKAVGTYVSPRDWNRLIDDPATLVIDTRNHFELGYGSFAGAIDPMTTSFSEFPAFVREKLAGDKARPVAMYCTGGIRCEKATSLLLAEGFTHVYHLAGGILRYLQEVPPTRAAGRAPASSSMTAKP